MDLKILHIADTCTGCGACMQGCPSKCITMEYDKEGFLYPVIDEEKCIDCRLCEKNCHVINNVEKEEITRSDFYMYYSADPYVRENSTSGGAFTLFAQEILKRGGIVFASLYNGRTERLEFSSTDRFELGAFRKSKYIESNTLHSFSETASELKKGRWVLYCGTPCHIAGLKRFLRKADTEKLVTVDFACHGVPANPYFTAYKRRFETASKKVVNADFRYKDFSVKENGWHDLSLKLTFSDGTSRVIPYKEPDHYGYYKPFMNNMILRKSCYRCYETTLSSADITIADFWGIRNYRPEIDDNKGISFFKLHTDKAKKIFDLLAPGITYEEIPFDLVKNPYKKREESLFPLKTRETIMRSIVEKGYVKAMKDLYRKDIANYRFRKYSGINLLLSMAHSVYSVIKKK